MLPQCSPTVQPSQDKKVKRIIENVYLKKEWIECGVVENDSQFYKIQYEFLLSHNFYTAYMQENGRDQKKKNIEYAKSIM